MEGTTEKRDAILAAGTFYHLTRESNWERIRTEGLRPECWDAGAYPGIHDPFICLAPSWHKDRYVGAIGDHLEQPMVQLVMPATAIADLRVELDRSTTELAHYRAELGTDDFYELLRAGVPIMCHDPIAPEHIAVHRTFAPGVRNGWRSI